MLEAIFNINKYELEVSEFALHDTFVLYDSFIVFNSYMLAVCLVGPSIVLSKQWWPGGVVGNTLSSHL